MYVSLQIGRALAAMSVAAFHLSTATGDPKFGGNGVGTHWDWFGQGNLGVDFFFVLSGFIILQAHRDDIDRPQRLARYGIRRATRIFPAYWVYLSACIVGMALVGSEFLELRTPLDWITVYGLVRLSDVGLPLAQAWTLFHEVVFYALFAVFMVGRRLGLAVFGVWFIAIVYFFTYPAIDSQNLFSTFFGAFNLNFFIGMLALLMVRHLNAKAALALTLAGLALLATVAMVTNDVNPIDRLLYGIGFGAVVSGVAALESLRKIAPAVALGFIGDASYSIYLLHFHVETYSLRALTNLALLERLNDEVAFWLVLAFTALVGCLAYQYLERPMLRWCRRRFEGHSSGTAGPELGRAVH